MSAGHAARETVARSTRGRPSATRSPHMSERHGPPDQPHPHAALGPDPIRTIDGDWSVRRDAGGLLDWENAGLPLEGGLAFSR